LDIDDDDVLGSTANSTSRKNIVLRLSTGSSRALSSRGLPVADTTGDAGKIISISTYLTASHCQPPSTMTLCWTVVH